MIQLLRDFFGCTRTEAHGFVVLALALVITLSSSIWLQPHGEWDEERLALDHALLDSMLADMQPATDTFQPRKAFPQQKFASTAFGQKAPFVPKFPAKKPKKFDLATADTAALMQLKGIGSKTAIRIVKFRDRRGGFHSLPQLNEVFGLSDEAKASLAVYATLPRPQVKRIPINTIVADSLIAHPYFGKKYGYTVVNYRSKHGPFRQASDLYKLYSVDSAWVAKVAPYLAFE